MSWPQWSAATQPTVPPVINPAQPVINSAPTVVPPGLQYTPEQWAQLQQQNWSQWAQWQQQYQQWHQQYGAEYQKSMNALAQAAQAQQPMGGLPNVAVPPPLPAEPKPPLPTEDPPPNVASYNTAPPPAPPSQPQPPPQQQGYNTAPPVRATEQRPPVHYPRNNPNQSWQNQNQYQNRYDAQGPHGPQTQGPHRPQAPHGPQGHVPHGPHAQGLLGPQGPAQNKRPYEQPLEHDPTKRPMYNKPGWQSQPPPQARPRENIEELSEAEKKFDKQFAEWEAQFQKWKEQNVEHPDKEQYREYEKKWESWRAQLLERREQMKRKRLGLPIEKPNQRPGSAQSCNQPNQNYNSPQQNFNQGSQQGYNQGYNQASRQGYNQGPQQGYNQAPKPQGIPPVGKPPPIPGPQVPPGPGSQGQITPAGANPVPFAKPPPNMNDEPLKFKDNKAAPDLEENVADFIKPNTGGGIPGLDLVKDEPPSTKKQANDDVVVIDPEEKEKEEGAEKKGPDFDAISKGINSILGDQKLLNMLSIVSQTQLPKTADNLTNTVSKITPESNSQNLFPEQSNQSFEEHSNHSATYNQREFVNNFDDQTRSSFTAHNDQETRFEPLGGLNKNQNQFSDRFGGNFQGNRFNNEPFKGPNQERFGGRDDRFGPGSDRFGPNQDRLGPNQDRFCPNQDSVGSGPDKFGFNQDRFAAPSFDRSGPAPGPDKLVPQDRFGPNQERSDRFGSSQGRFGPNQDRFGSNQDRFGPDQDRFEQNKFGPNQNKFGPKQNRFGANQDRFGLNQDKFGPNQDRGGAAQGRFGPGQDKFGSGQDRFEPGQDRLGPGQNRFGPNQDRFGPNQDRPGPGSDRFLPNKDRFGPNQDRFGPNQDKFAPNQDKFGNNQDRFGSGQDRLGPNAKFGPNKDRFGGNLEKFGLNQDKFGPNQDRFGPNQDRFGPQRNASDDRFGRNDRNFGPRGGPNLFGPGGGDNFDEEPYVAASFEHEEQHPPLQKEEPWKKDAGFHKEPWKKDKSYQQEPWKKGGGFQRDSWKNDGGYQQETWKDQEYQQQSFEEDYGQESWQDDQGYQQQPAFDKPPPNDSKPESAESEPSQEIFQPASVIDYEHKSIKPTEPEILIEPIHMFDYRHKPLSRIPLPQRPRWLSEAVKNIRDFDPPSIVRQYEIPRRYPPPKDNWRNDRYQDNWGPGSHRGRGYDDRRPYTERSYDEPRGPKNDWNSPGPKNDWNSPGPKNDWNSQKWEDRKPYNEEKSYRSEEKKPLFDYEEEKISDTEWPEDDDFEQEKCEGAKMDLPKFQKPEVDNKPSTKNAFLIEDLISPPGRYKRPPRIVIILRGPPGSGKTFLAKLIKDKEVENGGSAPRILSLDDYFMVEQEKEVTEEGKKVKVKEMVYEYEAEMEESYRTSLIKSFKKTITDGYFSFIIVDNVNDKVKYFGEMWSFAKQNGFQVYICQLDLDVQTCSKRNIHGRSEEDIQKCIANWEPTPSHHPVLDVTSLLQSASIPEVEMEEVNSPESEAPELDGSEDQVARSKWDNFDCSVDNLAKLDGVNKPLRQRTMEEYLQLDTDWTPVEPTKPGQKRVRWADLEEKKEQEKMRAIGFVVGHTNWDRMMDPTGGSSALTQTKYIERTGRYKVDQK